MKICFLLQRRFARVGHALAANIKIEHPETRFCAVTEPRYNLKYLREQKDVPYEGILLDEDLHNALYDEKLDLSYLKEKEREYGIPNLWPHLYVDRVLMSGQMVREYPHDSPSLSPEDMLRALQANIKLIEKFLDDERPDVVFMGVIASLDTSLLYHIAKKKGIKVIMFAGTRIGSGVILTEDYKTFTWADEIYKQTLSGRRAPSMKEEATKFLQDFRKNPKPYHPGLGVGVAKPKVSIFTSITWYTSSILKYITKTKRDYSDENPFWNIFDKAKRKLRELSFQSRYWSDLGENEKYSFFPLHLEPEMSLLLLAPRYTDQLHLIKQIARSLPIEQKLYVKEHPQMLGYRTNAFYKELLKIPNVKIIRPNIPGATLAKGAEIVFTISGTAAWEAILLGRPVITFGDVFYNELSFVNRARSYEVLSDLVHAHSHSYKYNEEELILFLSALMEDSVNAPVADLWTKNFSQNEIIANDGVRRLATLLFAKANI